MGPAQTRLTRDDSSWWPLPWLDGIDKAVITLPGGTPATVRRFLHRETRERDWYRVYHGRNYENYSDFDTLLDVRIHLLSLAYPEGEEDEEAA